MRIVIAEDGTLFREGLTRLLSEAGHQVIAAVGDADALVEAVTNDVPDLAVIDVRMPPTLTDDGARAAQQLRARYPDLPMLLLSQHIETRYSVKLVATGGFGYLLKDRVLRVDDFLDAVERVAAGGSALDPEVVRGLLAPTRLDDPIPSSRSANGRYSHWSPKADQTHRSPNPSSSPNARSRPTCAASSRSYEYLTQETGTGA